VAKGLWSFSLPVERHRHNRVSNQEQFRVATLLGKRQQLLCMRMSGFQVGASKIKATKP
jgi:hypothetical protein